MDGVVLEIGDDGVATVTLERPKAFNTLSLDVMGTLRDTLSHVAGDEHTRVLVIMAEGSGFCAGHDLKEIQAHRNDPDGGEAFYVELFETCTALMTAIRALPQPVIACVEGIAVAAGCQLVASCDMAVASETARFGVNGIDVGFFCSTPAVALSRNIGSKASMELLTTGRLIEAEEALTLGLVNRVAPTEETRDTALDMARRIADKPATVIALGKKAYYRQIEEPLAGAYAVAEAAMVANLGLEDSKEGIAAFIDKRRPVWSRR